MTSQPDERPAGIPPIWLRPDGAAIEAARPSRGRSSLDEAGVLPQLPAEARPATPEELQRIEAAEQQLREAQQEASRWRSTEPGSLSRLWQSVQVALNVAVVGGTCLFALFVYAQTVQVFAALAAAPAWLKYPGYALCLALVALVVYYGRGLLLAFYRLRPNRQVSVRELGDLAARAETRAQLLSDQAKAAESLRRYVAGYELSGPQAALLRRGGLEEPALEQLHVARAKLLEADGALTSERWCRLFLEQFQGRLDEAASRATRLHMKLVFVKTAVSPHPLVDAAVVVYSSYAMLGQLCRIYNLRLSGLGMLRLLGLVFVNAYLAGAAQGGVLRGTPRRKLFCGRYADCHGWAAGKYCSDGDGRCGWRRPGKCISGYRGSLCWRRAARALGAHAGATSLRVRARTGVFVSRRRNRRPAARSGARRTGPGRRR